MSLTARIILAAFAVLFGVIMFATATATKLPLLSHAIGVFCIAIALVCFLSGRPARFVGSLIATSILGLSICYLAGQVINGVWSSGARNKPSILNAAMFLVLFGLPALRYVIHARFGFGEELAPQSDDLEDEQAAATDAHEDAHQ